MPMVGGTLPERVKPIPNMALTYRQVGPAHTFDLTLSNFRTIPAACRMIPNLRSSYGQVGPHTLDNSAQLLDCHRLTFLSFHSPSAFVRSERHSSHFQEQRPENPDTSPQSSQLGCRLYTKDLRRLLAAPGYQQPRARGQSLVANCCLPAVCRFTVEALLSGCG